METTINITIDGKELQVGNPGTWDVCMIANNLKCHAEIK